MKITWQKLLQLAWIHFNFLLKSFSSRFLLLTTTLRCWESVLQLSFPAAYVAQLCHSYQQDSCFLFLLISFLLSVFFFFFSFYFVNFWHILLWYFVVLLTFLHLKYLLSQMFYTRVHKTVKIYAAGQGRGRVLVMSSRDVLRCISSPACFCPSTFEWQCLMVR